MTELNRSLRQKPTAPVLQRRQKSSPLLQRRKKADSQVLGPEAPKERKSGTKKKENIIINNNKKNLSKAFTSFSSFQGPSIPVSPAPIETSGVEVLKRRKRKEKQQGAPHLAESAKADNKEKDPLSKKQKRARLSFQETYNQPQKNKKLAPTSTQVTKAMKEIFALWDKACFETSQLVTIGDKRQDTKKFKNTCSLIRSFLNGTLLDHKLVVVPKYFKRPEPRKYTVQDFEKHLEYLKLQLVDKNYEPLNFREKVDLTFFFAGAMYTKFPSVLLAFCWNEPESKQVLDNEEDMQFITEPWKLISGTKSFSSRDLETFDTYLSWALPHFKRMHKNLDSLKNFDDEVDVMSFLTFGVLRNMKDRGKSFSPGILNQEFFRTMMEELRKKHGYTV